LTDYTWNHTTLWAIKDDPALTYLQCNFDPERVRDQFRSIRARLHRFCRINQLRAFTR
jgi:hypothetical protein